MKAGKEAAGAWEGGGRTTGGGGGGGVRARNAGSIEVGKKRPAGASAASPLLFDEPSADKTRGWVAATGGGLVAGGILAWWLSSPDEPAPAAKAALAPRLRLPMPSIVGLPAGPGEIAAPGPGLELRGELW